jgi:hypothetical protein
MNKKRHIMPEALMRQMCYGSSIGTGASGDGSIRGG